MKTNLHGNPELQAFWYELRGDFAKVDSMRSSVIINHEDHKPRTDPKKNDKKLPKKSLAPSI